MTFRCLRIPLLVLAAVATFAAFGAAPVRAGHETITVDGNLADLIAAVNNNLGSDKGAAICQDALGEIGTQQCAYFVNGYDIDKVYFFLDFKDASGNPTTNATLYVGFDQVGVIGDVDGNGDPNTFTPGHPCGASDNTGISQFESYAIDIDTDCNGAPDVRIGVKGDQVINFFTNAPVPGATFAVGTNDDLNATNGKDKLEIRIPNFASLLPQGADLCDMTLRAQSNAEFDFLGEDNCGPPFKIEIPPAIGVTKLPSPQDICEGENVSWAITVRNNGICLLNDVTVRDTLGTGLTYVSDDRGSTGGAQIRTWVFEGINLGPGQTTVINLTANVTKPCAAPVLVNRVTAEGLHRSPCRPEPALALANASATVNCIAGACVELRTNAPASACEGQDVKIEAWAKNCGSQPQTIRITIAGQFMDFPNVQPDAEAHWERTVSQGPCVQGVASYAVAASATSECGNDEKTATVRINCVTPQISVEKTADVTSVVEGTGFSFTITVRNPGTVPLENVVVRDTLCNTVTYGSSSPAPNSEPASGATGGIVIWNLGTLEPSASRVLTINVTAASGACPDDAVCENRVHAEGFCGSAKAEARASASVNITCPGGRCWMTQGGFQNGSIKSGHKEDTFGGNVGPPPRGSWEHIQRDGREILFNFHSQDVHVIRCYHDGGDGPCHPHADANVIEFGGTGFYSIGNGPRTEPAVWTARAEDHGEPGSIQGKGGCGSLDFYTIEVRNAVTNATVFTASGFLDGGNIQIHQLKKADSGNRGGTGNGRGPKATGGDAGVSGDDGVQLGTLELYRPTPNPFNSTTRIAYAVGGSGEQVEIGVYDVSGRQVKQLVSGFMAAGRYEVAWDGRTDGGFSVKPGVYFLRAVVGAERITGSRILYLK